MGRTWRGWLKSFHRDCPWIIDHFFTTRRRSLREGNVVIPVSQSVHGWKTRVRAGFQGSCPPTHAHAPSANLRQGWYHPWITDHVVLSIIHLNILEIITYLLQTVDYMRDKWFGDGTGQGGVVRRGRGWVRGRDGEIWKKNWDITLFTLRVEATSGKIIPDVYRILRTLLKLINILWIIKDRLYRWNVVDNKGS